MESFLKAAVWGATTPLIVCCPPWRDDYL